MLVLAGLGFAGSRVRHRHAGRIRPPHIVVRQALDESAGMDRAELARLRDDNAKLRAKVRVLSDIINGPEVRS